ncbi:MAG: pyruvate synthase subunit beta [Deltaproteobacteria bacterium]|nr:pyruvate synthase subunit beta [Deltaproteobacteria bacterium]MBW2070360.1 pyruvate synthase subunit beta [Deltaproteobacteria bacterium]
MATNVLQLPEEEYILPGTRSCSGCGLALAYRHILKALGQKTILTIPASCLTVLHGLYPSTSVKLSNINTAFATTAASASGIVAALKALGKTDFTVVGVAGDGGTYDIGIQALSAAAERNTDFIYICYDNEGYMNTGTQRSSATPMGAFTTTTPTTKLEHKKDMLAIMEAHGIPYIASASAAYPLDLYDKVKKAKTIRGTRFILVNVPCSPGWGFPTRDVVKLGKLAIDTAMCVLHEVEDGVFRLTGRSRAMARSSKKKPVADYLKMQGRFRHIDAEHIDLLQEWLDQRWTRYVARHQLCEGGAEASKAGE